MPSSKGPSSDTCSTQKRSLGLKIVERFYVRLDAIYYAYRDVFSCRSEKVPKNASLLRRLQLQAVTILSDYQGFATSSTYDALECRKQWEYLIERLTEICTGSAYHDHTLLGGGFKCEMGSVYNGQTIIQKAHYIHRVNTTRILHLIRLPLDAALADFHRRKTQNNHTGVAESSVFRGDETLTMTKKQRRESSTRPTPRYNPSFL